jgi:hypothetical protein
MKRTNQHVLGLVIGLGMVVTGTREAAGQLLYQWNFVNGTAVPNVTAGGGTLTITNNAMGSSAFASSGGWTGAANDGYYNSGGTSPGSASVGNEYGNGAADGIASTSSGNVLTGLGTLSSFTVTMWINPAVAWGTTATSGASLNNSRLFLLGGSSYDEGTTSPGFALALNSGNSFQVAIGGSSVGVNPTLASNAGSISGTLTGAGQSAATGQWVFVAFAYDGSASNVFFDPAISTATGGAEANNDYMYIADAGNSNLLLMTPSGGSGAIQSGNASPGSIAFSSSTYAFLGNRSSFGRDFLGGIDGVSIYNGVLTQSQLAAINSIPEPASLGVIASGGLILMQRRRRA